MPHMRGPPSSHSSSRKPGRVRRRGRRGHLSARLSTGSRPGERRPAAAAPAAAPAATGPLRLPRPVGRGDQDADPAASMKVTPDMLTASWTFPPLMAAMRKRRMAGQVEMSISPSRTTAAEGGSETTVVVMDAPASHEANGKVQTACARQSTPGGRDLATSGGCTGPAPGSASHLARPCQPSGG